MSCSGWNEYVLSDLMEIIGGGTPKTTVDEYWNGNINWISIKDFNGDNKYIINTEKTITELGLNKSSTKLLKENDIIISARGTVGALGVIKRPMAFNQSCYGLRAKEGVNSDFLYYLLKNTLNILKSNTHGSVFDTITKDTFNNITVKIPSGHEQEILSELLCKLDEKIELNNEMNKTLEEMAQALFKRWFVDFEFPNEEGKPYKSSGGEMVESELGMIPKGWSITKLGQLMDIVDNRGKTPPLSSTKTRFPIIDVKALSGNSRIINYDTCSKFVDEETYNTWFRSGHPKTNDILLSTVGTIGEMKIFYGDVGCIAQNVIALRPKEVSAIFLYQYLKHIKGQLVAYNIGSVQPSIKVTQIIKHKILLCSKDVETRFNYLIESVSKQIFENVKENMSLKNLRDSLLPKLMSGEIRVEDIEASL